MSNLGDISAASSVARHFVDVEANRPTSGYTVGDKFFATDTNRRYVARADLTWQDEDDEVRKLREQMELNQQELEYAALVADEPTADKYGFELR